MTFVHRPTTRKRAQTVAKLPLIPAPSPAEKQRSEARQALARHTARPVAAQRQAVQAPLRAATLDRQEVQRLQQERQAVQAQLRALPAGSERPADPVARPVPAKPATPDEWVTVLRHRAGELEGQRLDARTFGAFQALQRQVAQQLAQGFRADRSDTSARYASYGEQFATLQRHALSAPVARVVLGMVSPVERLPLQRATDEALQRLQAQESAALHFEMAQSLQRQLAELDAEATQPVLARIQARRGGGNPLPEAIRRHLERGLNHDLSRVRIHDDAEADKLAKGVNALAFTTGTDIFFRAGHFNPNTQSGLELLAHEVTHTVQQSQGRVGSGIDPDAGLEVEARAMGAKLARVMPSTKTLIPPVPHQHGLYAPGVYSAAAALGRAQQGAVTAALHRPFQALGLQRQTIPTIQRSFLGDQISGLAGQIPGYRELCLAFGRDLVTGKTLAQNPNAILDALAKLVPGPFQDMLRVVRGQNLIPKAWAWFQGELGKLRLGQALTEVKAAVTKFPPDLGAAKSALTRRADGLKRLVSGAGKHLAGIALTAIEAGLGPVGKKVMSLLRQSGDVVMQVLRDPAKFAGNLLRALTQGFMQFRSNAGRWLKDGLGSWLTGASGIQFPATLDVKGVFLTALSVMGLTYQALRGRLVKELGSGGEQKVALAEKAGGALASLTKGLHQAPEVKGQQGAIGQGVVDSLKKEVTTSLMTAGAAKVASLLVPGGAFVQALLTAFSGVQTLISQGSQIMGVVLNALGSVQAIAAGQVAAAAGFVERTIGGSIPVVLTFLGRLVGLGNIGTRIRNTVKKLRTRLDATIDKLTGRIKKFLGIPKANVSGASAALPLTNTPDQRSLVEKEKAVAAAAKAGETFMKSPEATTETVEEKLKELQRQYSLTTFILKAINPHTYKATAHINPSQSTAPVSLVSKNDLRNIIDSAGGIIDFMYAIARGGAPGGITRADLDKYWKQTTLREDVLKARFRAALNGGEHEWIPTNKLLQVIDRTAGTEAGVQAADWISVQHQLRTDTHWIVFQPDKGEARGYTDGRKYLALMGHVGSMYLVSALRPDGVPLTKGTKKFHDALRVAFEGSKTVNQALGKAKQVFREWVWDGTGGPGHQALHPDLAWSSERWKLQDPTNLSRMKSQLAKQYGQTLNLFHVNRTH